MTFIGFSTTIQSKKGDVKCPEFWKKEYTQKYARLWQTIQQETPGEKAILENGIGMFALCDDKHSSFEYCAGLYKGEVPNGLIFMLFPKTIGRFYPAAVVLQRGQAVYGGRKRHARSLRRGQYASRNYTNSAFGYRSLSRGKAQKTARESHLPQRCRVFYKTYPRSGIDKPGSHTKGRYHKEPLCTCVSRSRAYCFSVAL